MPNVMAPRTLRAAAAVAAAALCVGGCTSESGTSAAAPAAAGSSPAAAVPFVAPAPCGTVETDGPVGPSTRPPRYLFCASMSAPDDPTRRVSVTILSDQQQQPLAGRTPLLYHPGGPGVSPGRSLREDPPGADLRHHVVVAVDGASAGQDRQACGPLSLRYGVERPALRRAELLDAAAEVADECGVRADFPSPAGAVQAAEELERVRTLLDLGIVDLAMYSYGTAVGQRYLQLYPTAVRRAVLDGPFVPDQTWGQRQQLVRRATDVAVEQALSCAALECTAPLRQVLADRRGSEALARLREAVLSREPTIGASTLTLTAATFDQAVWSALRSRDYLPGLGRALDQALAGDASSLYSTAEQATAGLDRAAYYRTVCSDLAVPTQLRPAEAEQTLAAVYDADVAPCRGVRPARVPQVPWPTSGAPEVLVLGSSLDPLTPVTLITDGTWLAEHAVVCRSAALGHTLGRSAAATALTAAFLREGRAVLSDGCPAL